MRLPALLLAVLLLAGQPTFARETVTSAGLPAAHNRCLAADMGSVVRLDGRYYVVTCVAKPPTILLSKRRAGYAVAQCYKLGMDALVEVRKEGIRVSCVVL